MESGSRADSPADRTSQKAANIIGTFIALLTLTLPLFAIAYFSPGGSETWQTPTYGLIRARNSGD